MEWFHQPFLEEALLGPGQTIGQEDLNCPERLRHWTAFGFIMLYYFDTVYRNVQNSFLATF